MEIFVIIVSKYGVASLRKKGGVIIDQPLSWTKSSADGGDVANLAYNTNDTGWKLILLYAVARSRWACLREPAGQPWNIARQSGAQCKIGFQPVVSSSALHQWA
jgi:hypothetical protein